MTGDDGHGDPDDRHALLADERFVTLDFVRGVAVMGILVMNIQAFALPFAAYLNPLAHGGGQTIDLWAWAVEFVLVDGKMRALFSLLFGASMLLVIARADAAGRNPIWVHGARMAVLLGIGAAHFAFLWYGDILMLYAVCGLFAALFVSAPPRLLIAVGLLSFVVTTAMFALSVPELAALRDAGTAPGASAGARAAWNALVADLGVPPPDAVAAELALYRGGYAGIFADRIGNHSLDMVRILMLSGPETLGLMLMGMAALKTGFLTGAWPAARYRRWALVGLILGVPPMAALAVWTWAAGFDPVTVFATGFAWSTPFRPVLTVAYAALAILLVKQGASWWTTRIAAAGRMALSNYLGTSLVMTTLFYGYGLGLFGSVGRALLLLPVAIAWAAMLWWSKPWLDRFRHGPIEWLWRCAARGRWQALRR